MEKKFTVVRRKDAKLDFEGNSASGSALDRVITEAVSDEMGGGYFAFNGAETTTTMAYDELAICLEGVLRFMHAGVTYDLAPGDFAWLPKGTEVTFSGDKAVAFYAAHPVDWRTRKSAGA
jgi:ethanolamine utilization protein EutQ